MQLASTFPKKAASNRATGDDRRTGVIDIGSNSIRLVVFEGPPRGVLPKFNEKVMCGLGRGLDATGHLDPDGVGKAMTALRRFVALARQMEVDRLHAVATAAVREATDGDAFKTAVEQAFDITVEVLSGEREAELAGLGVLHGLPKANGLVADLGGGSLEMVELVNGAVGRTGTLPLGPLRFDPGVTGAGLSAEIDARFSALPWLPEFRGRTLYIIGGAWRALAKMHMAQTDYPLYVIDNYEIAPGAAKDFTRLLSRQSLRSLARITSVSSRRIETVPLAAKILRRLLLAAEPGRIVFSANGLREGLMFSELDEAERSRDPLIEESRLMARHEHRFEPIGDRLFDWISPLFPQEDAKIERLRRVACLLSDVAWNVHPHYRDAQAFRRVFRAPFAGIMHAERALVALAIYTRYGGRSDGEAVAGAMSLIDDDVAQLAARIGYALRLAYTFSGGLPRLIDESRLVLTDEAVVLQVSSRGEPLLGESVEKRLATLARAYGREAKVQVDGTLNRPS